MLVLLSIVFVVLLALLHAGTSALRVFLPSRIYFGSTYHESFLLFFILLIGIVAIGITGGISVFTPAVLCIVLHMIFGGKGEARPKVKYLKELQAQVPSFFIALLVFVAVLAMKTGGRFDVQMIAYFGDHYCYTGMAQSLLNSGLETHIAGLADSGVQDIQPYHYTELYLAGALGMWLGIPVVLVFEYVAVPLFLYLIISPFLQRVKRDKWMVGIALFLLAAFFPTIVRSEEEFLLSAVIFREVKLLVILVFLSPVLIAIFEKRNHSAILFLSLLIFCYSSTVFASFGVLASLAAYEYFRRRKLGDGAQQYMLQLGISFILVLGYMFMLKFLAFEEVRGKGSGILSFAGIKERVLEFIRLLRWYGVAMIVSYALHIGLALILCWKLIKNEQNWSLTILLFVGIIGSFVGAAYFNGVTDGSQIATNFSWSLLTGFAMLYLCQTSKRWVRAAFFVAVLHYAGAYYYVKEVPRITESQAELYHSLKLEPDQYVGSHQDTFYFQGQHFSLTAMNHVGKELANFTNQQMINVADVSNMLKRSNDYEVSSRLRRDRLSLIAEHTQTSKKAILGKKVPIIFSAFRLENNPLFESYHLTDSMPFVHEYSADRYLQYSMAYVYRWENR